MATTTTKTTNTSSRPVPPPLKSAEPNQKQQVAVVAPPRLLPPPATELERYDVDGAGWRTLVESIFPAAKTVTSVLMALDYCKRRKLDVFKHPVHIVPIWNSSIGERGGYVETIWPGINELRTTAMRTGQFAGMDEPKYGPTLTSVFKGKLKKRGQGGDQWENKEVTVTHAEWCSITVYRLLNGQRMPFPGPRVFWLETYAKINNFADIPNAMWEKRSNGQHEKCAEAAALRRAFPEEIGSDYSIDENRRIQPATARRHHAGGKRHGVADGAEARRFREEGPARGDGHGRGSGEDRGRWRQGSCCRRPARSGQEAASLGKAVGQREADADGRPRSQRYPGHTRAARSSTG